jgi:hypothetical protein
MAKKFLEDMVQARRARLGTQEIKPRSTPVFKKTEVLEMPESVIVSPVYSKKRSRYMLWFVAAVSIIFCLFAFSFLFSRAEVTVNPKMQEVVLNENLSASKDSSGDGLFFDLVVISGEENKIIQVTGLKEVKEKATGNVVLYNAFSTAPQVLAIDTRLEGSNGKIYKTQTKNTVPGMSKAGIPGSVEVKIYGAEAGVDYNSAPLDFKVLGFKGTSKYAKFYGRSKGEISGGFIGQAPALSLAEKSEAESALKTALQAKLLQKATDQIPSGFILFKDAIFLNVGNGPSIPAINSEDKTLTLTEKGTLYGILFNEQKLTQKIAEDNIVQYDGSEIYIPNIRELTFRLADKDNFSLGDAQNINFNLSGSAKLVFKLDPEKFTADLSGKSKKDFNLILSGYSNIDSATLTLNPFWKMSIPDEAKNIKILVNYPQ